MFWCCDRRSVGAAAGQLEGSLEGPRRRPIGSCDYTRIHAIHAEQDGGIHHKRTYDGDAAAQSNVLYAVEKWSCTDQDYPPPFSPLQYDGTYVKNGQVVYEGTSFAGVIGIGGTCMVPGKYSAEINARDSSKPSLSEAIASAKAGNLGLMMMLRKGCEQGIGFEDAVKYYSDTPLIQGGYVTAAGAAAGEGAIVTRGAHPNETDILRLSSGYPAEKPWFLVQTNYDHWKDVPWYDNRRGSAICLMENIGADNVDLEALWGVVSDNGKGQCKKGLNTVYNVATIHTELVVPATSEYHTYLRHNIIEDVVV